MLTQKDYCDYDTCVALKELGYIGQGRHYYDRDKDPNKLRHFGVQVLTTRSAEALNFVLAVHLYEAQKWLREEKKIHITIFVFKDIYYWEISMVGSYASCKESLTDYSSYEEALLEGIKEAIKLLKECENTED